MNVGVKIANLRKNKKLSQPELAHRLGISQTALCDIESGKTKKIDFMLMDKVCKEFEVDSDFFMDDKQVNNVKKNEGTIAYSVGTINNCPDSIVEQIKSLIKDSKQKDEIIAELKARLKKYEE
jgi:transcriptional regulator with XRE-family HTH domain